jgi:hypothetical protein
MDADVQYDCGDAGIGDADYADGKADWVVLTSPLVCLQISLWIPAS